MRKTIACITLTILGQAAYDSMAQASDMNSKKQTDMVQTVINKTSLSSQERDYAVKFLRETSSQALGAIQGLTGRQLAFKPAEDKWSIEECMKHIAAAEATLWGMVEQSLKQPANPEKRTGIQLTDQELVKAVKDRTRTSKTFAALEPANAPYQSPEEAVSSFQKNREKLILFVKETEEDLRNHVSVLPIGTYDAYQFILLISAHTHRHTQQIEEVKDNVKFPKE